MDLRLVTEPTASNLAGAAREMELGPGRVLAVLLAEEDRPDLDQVVAQLGRLDLEFWGAVVPSLIYGAKAVSRGALLVALEAETQPVLVRGLEREQFPDSELRGIEESARGAQTAIVLVDGLAANVSGLLSELFTRLGNRVNYIGGGAGSLSLEQSPCVFTRDGAFQDAAVIAFCKQATRLGVRHGWSHLEGPVVATRTKGNTIYELNWECAFEVYRDAVAPYIDLELSHENIFQVTNAFPFGIHKEGDEDVVRDPVAVGKDGELICVGAVPENVVLNILRGDAESLILAAGQAASDCCEGPPIRARGSFVVDCVSRTLFLGDEFPRELGMVRSRLDPIAADEPLCGMLSLGEISSDGEGFVQFLNKSIVTAVFHD